MRSLNSGAVTALSAPQVAAVLLIEMAYSTPLRVCTANVPIVWGGNTYLGAGPLGAIEPVADSSGDAQGLRFTLSGVPSENLGLALGVSARNRACTIRLAIMDAATQTVQDAPLLGAFVMDQTVVAGNTISVTAFPMSKVFARPKPLRYTDGDQQLVSAGDRALEFLVSQSTHQDVWPAASWGRQ